MRRFLSVFLVLVLFASCLALIAMEAASPLLYSQKDSPPTPGQVNPASLEPLTGGRARQILPVMSDLLDAPGTLILNIRNRDFEEAARDLQEMRELTRSLDNLVINLDMTEGEISEFRQANQKNLQILSDLFNGTERWDELHSLEIRFRDAGDPRALTSITYEGEALRHRIQELYQEYQGQSTSLLPASRKFELDTTEYEESRAEFGELVQEIDSEQEIRIQELRTRVTPIEPPFRLTLDLDRRFAFYQSPVGFRGVLSGEPSGTPRIDLFIDTEKIASVPAGGDGDYEYTYVVKRLPAGSHTAFAVYADSAYSEIRTFRIEETAAQVFLELPVLQDGRVVCQGILTADSLPVPDAQVEILSGGRRVALTSTDEGGRFRTSVILAPGIHRIKGYFDHGAFPLTSAVSEVHEITVPEPPFPSGTSDGFPLGIPDLLLAGGILGCAFLGAVGYLRYRGHGAGLRQSSPTEVAPGVPEGSRHPEVVPSLDQEEDERTALARYREMAGTDLREAVFILFSCLRRTLAARLSLLHPHSLTPGELCVLSRELSFSSRLCAFLRRYEEVRYGDTLREEGDSIELADSFRSLLEDAGGDRN